MIFALIIIGYICAVLPLRCFQLPNLIGVIKSYPKKVCKSLRCHSQYTPVKTAHHRRMQFLGLVRSMEVAGVQLEEVPVAEGAARRAFRLPSCQNQHHLSVA